MKDRQLFLAVAWLIPLITIALGPFQAGDLAVWVAHGLASLDRGQILQTDIFSVLPTSPLVYPPWGISIIYGIIFQIGGLMAVGYFHVLAGALILWLIYRNSVFQLARPEAWPIRALLYLSWAVMNLALGTRPNTIAHIPLLFFVLEILKVESFRDLNRSKLCRLSAIAAIWANIHGSFVLAPALLTWKLAFLLPQKRNEPGPLRAKIFLSLGSIALVIAATLLNPFGIQIYSYLYQTQEFSRQRAITEWMMPILLYREFPTGLGVYILAIFSVAVFWNYRRSGRLIEWLSSPFIPLLALGLTGLRHVALPFIVLLPTLKQWGLLDQWSSPRALQDHQKNSPLWNVTRIGFVLVLVAALAISLSPQMRPKIAPLLPARYLEMFDDDAPMKIAETIRSSGKSCPIFNTWDYGSYLMLATKNSIFLDTRNIIYSKEVFEEYNDAISARPGWQRYLAVRGACFAVIDQRQHQNFITEAQKSGQWRQVMTDRGAVLLERVETSK